MAKVYAITKQVEGPAGHGEPGMPYLALLTDGKWFDLGKPFPIFYSFEDAETLRESIDKYGFYNIVELDII